MATPTIASLAERYPDARIDVAVGPWARVGLAGNPRVAGLVDCEGLLGARLPRADALLRVAARLRRGRYDGAVVLERSLWLCLLPLLAGIPVRIGLDSGGRGAAHTLGVEAAGLRHEADLYLDCVRALGPGRLIERLEFRPDRAAEAAAGAALARAGWRGQPFVLIHPGGGQNPGGSLVAKRWPPERFAAVASALAGRGLASAVVWGPGDDRSAAPMLAEARRLGAADLLELGTGLTLPAVAALAGRAALHLGNDTGASHLAVAVGTPTVVVFGPSDERRFGPFGRRADGRPIGLAVACPPLADDDPAPAFLARSTAAVSVEQVLSAIDRQLGDG
ncbi:MAG TPA: glycosyltransferase family 9 protein [Chloroflexota bacterium]